MNIKTNGSQKESKPIDIPKTGKNDVMHYSVDYDTTNPSEKLRQFISDAKGMVARYEQNESRLRELETQICDLEHYIEIAPYQNVPKGYRLYRKIAELRRERRACKNENDLLRPVYDHFHATGVLTKLNNVCNEVTKTKYAVNGRCYTVRTSILEEWVNPEKNEEPEGMSADFSKSDRINTYKEYRSEMEKMMEA